MFVCKIKEGRGEGIISVREGCLAKRKMVSSKCFYKSVSSSFVACFRFLLERSALSCAVEVIWFKLGRFPVQFIRYWKECLSVPHLCLYGHVSWRYDLILGWCWMFALHSWLLVLEADPVHRSVELLLQLSAVLTHKRGLLVTFHCIDPLASSACSLEQKKICLHAQL